MNEDDDYLLGLADAALDARPLDWAAIAGRASEEQRRLIAGLQSVAEISAFHLDSSLSARTAALDSTSLSDSTGGALHTSGASTWGPLTLTGWIGRGRFGDVYRARDARLDRPVALKLLRHQPRESEEAAAVIEEGRLMARVRHPNVVTVYGAERVDDRVGLWMELIDGRTLEEELRHRGSLPWKEVCRIGSELSQALAAVHRAGLLHRDLKAQNVLREKGGRVVLADFGAGRILSGEADDQVDVAGTPLYLAPEVFDGKPATAASDIYSLGVLLFHLVTGSYPVRGRSMGDLREAHRQHRRTALREARADLPASFVAIVDRALAVDPAERYANADELAAMLDRLVAEQLVEPSSSTSWRSLAFVAVAVLLVAPLPLTIALRGSRVHRNQAAVASETEATSPRKVRLRSFQVDVGSHDGSVIPYLDEHSRLQLLDVMTGRSHQLTDTPPAPESIGRSAASPTGDRVAYGWSLGPGGFELRLVNADGTWPRVLIARQTAFEPVPVDWSRDGTAILCWLHQKNGSADLVLVPAEGGPVRLVHSVSGGAPAAARLSPDGRFAVASLDDPDSPAADIVIIDTVTLTSSVLADNALKDGGAIWTPDGRRVLFQRSSSEKSGEIDAWVVDVVDGAAHGAPSRHLPNVGFARMAVADSGHLYSTVRVNSAEVYTRSIDLYGRSDAGPPTRIETAAVGNHAGPAWSPDGRSIAYFTTRESDIPGANPVRTLTVQDVATGQVRLMPLPMAFLSGYSPRWSPDSTSLVVFGWDRDDSGRAGHYRVDLQSGELNALVVHGNNNVPPLAEFAPDGEHLLYRDPSRGIVSRRIADGADAVVVPAGTRGIDRFFVASDGHAIALLRSRQRGDDWTTTLEVRQQDGAIRELASRTSPRRLDLHGWSPDARDVIYSDGRATQPHQFFRVSEAGGPAVDLRFSTPGTPNAASFSPDGLRVAYTERVVEYEVWITPFSTNAQ